MSSGAQSCVPEWEIALPAHYFESEYFRPATYSQLHLLQLTDCFSMDFLAKWTQGYYAVNVLLLRVN